MGILSVNFNIFNIQLPPSFPRPFPRFIRHLFTLRAPALANYKTPVARIELGVWVLLDALGEATNRLNAQPAPVDTVAIKKSTTRVSALVPKSCSD